MPKIKSVVLGVVTLALQAGLWWYMHQSFSYQASSMTWVWVSLLAACMISVSTFFFLTDKMRWYSELIIALSALSYFLISTKNEFVWIGGILFVAFTFWYELRLHGEAQNRLDFSVSRVVSSSVSLMVYGLLLLIGFNIYYNVQTKFQQNPDEFYNRLGQQAAKSVPYFTSRLPAGTNLNEPFSQYLQDQAKQDPSYNKLGSFGQAALYEQAKAGFQQEFQIQAQDNQSLADIISEVAVSRIKQAAQPFDKYLPLIFTVIILSLLYAFAFLLRWAIIIISWILFQILLLTGFFKFEKVVVEVKKLVI